MRNQVAHEEMTEGLLAELPWGLRETLRHVLGCPVCQGLARQALREGEEEAGRRGAGRPEDPRPLLCLLELHVPGLLESLERKVGEAERLFQELLRQPAERRLALAGRRVYRNLCLADFLLDTSEEEGVDVARSEELARLALRIASQTQPEEEVGWAEDVKVRGYCLLGNARRLQKDRRGAEEAFGHAAYHLTQPPDSCERALYCRMVGLLRQEQGRLDEAVGLYWRAAGIYLDAAELREAGRCLAELGLLFVGRGEHDRAIPPLEQAAELVDGRGTPGLMARVRLGLALCQAALGHWSLARCEEEAARPYCQDLPEGEDLAAVHALRGQIAELRRQEG